MGSPWETERLLVRSLQDGDLPDYHRLIYADEEVCRHYAGKILSLQEARQHLSYRILEARYSDFQRWAIVRQDDQQFIGVVGLEGGPNYWYRLRSDPEPIYNEVEVELSFALGREFWGNGYATDACEPVIDHAFTEMRLPRLLGGFSRENERSYRLHRRLGFRIEEHAAEDGYVALLPNTRLDNGPTSPEPLSRTGQAMVPSASQTDNDMGD